jgi:UDP-3-O-[3-hydroxymyristoyl] glucosamine N-acyltransferase
MGVGVCVAVGRGVSVGGGVDVNVRVAVGGRVAVGEMLVGVLAGCGAEETGTHPPLIPARTVKTTISKKSLFLFFISSFYQ